MKIYLSKYIFIFEEGRTMIFLHNRLLYFVHVIDSLTSAVQPFVAVCVQGLGPQLVQVTISFAPVVPPVVAPPSRFFLPYDRVSVEETHILNYTLFFIF